MTRSFSPDGIPAREVVDYYRRRAAGGVGMIITEGIAINRPAAKNNPRVPNFHGAALSVWKEVVDAVHSVGGVIVPQLWHIGASPSRKVPAWAPPAPFDSPSGISAISPTGEIVGEPMTEEGIADVIAAFARGARDAANLRFDAVELHGAHGYLIDQFFFASTNRRKDKWGGATLADRVRFAVEIVRTVRAAIGPNMPLILRISQWKEMHYQTKLAQSPEELRAWLEPLVMAGVDVFHCSQRRFWEHEFPGSDLNFAGWVKKVTGSPTITVGSVGLSGEFVSAYGGEYSKPTPLDELLRRLDRGDFDLVAVGRAMIVNPDWPRLIREGRFDLLKGFDMSALQTLL